MNYTGASRNKSYISDRVMNVKYKTGGGILQNILFLSVIIVATVILIFLCFRYVLVIREVKIQNTSVYTDDEILAAAGINKGTRMYGFNRIETEEKVAVELPYVKSISISRMPISAIKITVIPETPAFVITLGSDTFTVSEDFKTLGCSGNGNTEGLLEVKTYAIKRMFVGETLEFSNPDTGNIIKSFLEAMSETETTNDVTFIDLTDKFNITLQYGGRFEILFGNFDNISVKYTFMLNVMDELPKNERGVINIMNEKEASYRYLY